jgi:hypothetical protein
MMSAMTRVNVLQKIFEIYLNMAIEASKPQTTYGIWVFFSLGVNIWHATLPFIF